MRILSTLLLTALFLAPGLVRAADPNPSAIKTESGYKIEAFATNLSVPTNVTFDGNDLVIAESGFENTAKPRVLRIGQDGKVTVLAEEGLQNPVTGVLVHDGQVYVSHRTKVSVIQPDKSLKDIVTDLPSTGDHQNNSLVLGPDGKMYISQGTATNSAVVGIDNYLFGWLTKDNPTHDIPCRDITLLGRNYETESPFTGEKVTTGAYKLYGVPSSANEVIKGSPKCNGSILRFNSDGSNLEMVAWGFRNPFGLAFDKTGQLWATSHGADVRGSRPIYNDADSLIKVKEGGWYGWPDFFDGESVNNDRFDAPTADKPEQLWKDHPQLEKAFTKFASHSGANGIAFAPKEFGFENDAFVALFGTYEIVTSGDNISQPGFSVVRVDSTGKVNDFVSNRLPGPSYINRTGGLNRPTTVAFAPDNSMYIIDWGEAKLTEKGLEYVPETGIIWRVYPENGSAIRASGPIVVPASHTNDADRKAAVRNVPQLYAELAPTALWLGFLLLVGIAVFVYGVNRFLSLKKRR